MPMIKTNRAMGWYGFGIILARRYERALLTMSTISVRCSGVSDVVVKMVFSSSSVVGAMLTICTAWARVISNFFNSLSTSFAATAGAIFENVVACSSVMVC